MWTSTWALTPSTEEQVTVIVNDAGELHPEANGFFLGMVAADRSPNTATVYGRAVARFLTWCEDTGLDWRTITLTHLGRFKMWYAATPTRWGSPPADSTVSIAVSAVCSFLRWCAAERIVGSWVAEQLVEPRLIGSLPDRSDPSTMVKARRLVVKVPEQPVIVPPDDVLQAILTGQRKPRPRFLVQLLWCTAMRIGEALTLHRDDVHTLPDSRAFGCGVQGPHVHVGRNAGRLRSKSGPRCIPIDDETVERHHDYLEYLYGLGVRDADELFVNTQKPTVGRPMSYETAYELFERISRQVDYKVTPHVLRHAKATAWVRAGVDLDVVRNLLGHASLSTTTRYLHASDDDLRAAIDTVR